MGRVVPIVILSIVGCLAFMVQQCVAEDPGPERPTRQVELAGDLRVGDDVYTVQCRAELSGNQCRSLAMSIRLGMTPIASLNVRITDEDQPTLSYGGRSYRLPAEMMLAWSQFLCLTDAEVRRRFRGTAAPRDAGKWAWEVADQIMLRPGLPAKMFFVFPAPSGGGETTPSPFTEVVVWSLAEWNNPFNDNLLLHLTVVQRELPDE